MDPCMDIITERPRTPNDQYTVMTEEQIRNLKNRPGAFFHTMKRDPPSHIAPPREGGRYYKDHYCNSISQHLVRGARSLPYGYVEEKHDRNIPDAYNTCAGSASVRWGPPTAGERTRSHFFGESIDRYTNIDMYRRNPTNQPGRVTMDHGRAADGYYAPRNPSRTAWTGSTVPFNKTEILNSVHKKTCAEYNTIKMAEQSARVARVGEWPEFSEYTDRYLLNAPPVLPPISGRCMEQEKA